MSPSGSRAWRGRVSGAAVGVGMLTAGALQALPEYNDAWPGVPLAAGGALVAFGAGLWWDRRAARAQEARERAQAWQQVFTNTPAGSRSSPIGDGSWFGWLDPARQAVKFEAAHLPHVTAIRRWCTDGLPGRVWLLAGGPGSGKTRVAMRVQWSLARRQDDPWACGWLRAGPGRAGAAVDLAAGWRQPVLVVVDDAELRDDLPELLAAVHGLPAGAQQVRVLLIAREFGSWWAEIRQQLRVGVDTAAAHTWVGPLGGDVAGQVAAARRAVDAFAGHPDIGVEVTGREVRMSGISAGTPALLLHATALEAVAQAGDGYTAPVDVGDAVASLLDREHDRWQTEAARLNLTAGGVADQRVLRDVLVLGTLVGATDEPGARQLLRRVPGLSGIDHATAGRVIGWTRLYGVVAGYHLRPHLPAVLAEHLVAQALADTPVLADAVTAAADGREQDRYLVAVIARAATHTPAALDAAQTLLAAAPRRLLPLAIAMTRHGIGPLDHPIAAIIRIIDLDWDAAATLYDQIPDDTQALLHTAVALAEALTRTAATTARRARGLNEYAQRLHQVGQVQEAVPVAREAVTTWRELVAVAPDAHQRFLASALTILGNVLRAAGRRQEAVPAAREAVTIRRELAAADPDAHQEFLAIALTALALALREAGHRQEAVIVAREAITTWRELVAADPDAHQSLLADALIIFANVLRAAGHRQEAVLVAREAVTTWRELAAVDPDAHQIFVAIALTALAHALREAGHRQDAVFVAGEAVTACRVWAAVDPDAHQSLLADALTAHANALRAADHRQEAVFVAREAVTIRRELAAVDPDANQSFLAGALTVFALALREAGHQQEALLVAREAVTTWRELAAVDPDAHRSSLADALAILADALRYGSDQNELTAVVAEAIALYEMQPNGQHIYANNLRILRTISSS